MAGYVLDTSAIMAVILREEGALDVRDVMLGTARVMVPFIAMMEIEYKLLRIKPEVLEESLALINEWPVQTVESTYSWRREAARVKARGRLSFADAWVAALALVTDATLVHKDPEFEGVDGLKMLKLPYDRDAIGRGQ